MQFGKKQNKTKQNKTKQNKTIEQHFLKMKTDKTNRFFVSGWGNTLTNESTSFRSRKPKPYASLFEILKHLFN